MADLRSLSKVVYFDEYSVTDYVQIVCGGELEKTKELLTSNSKDANAGISGEISKKPSILGLFTALSGLKADISADASAHVSFNSEKLMKNIVKNTILTDFLEIMKDCNIRGNAKEETGEVICFQNYKISVVKDSLSYVIIFSPFMNLFKNDTIIPAGEYDLSLDKVDNVLRNAKGYYEFIGEKSTSIGLDMSYNGYDKASETDKVILRFNINSFRNGYSCIDLLKMDLKIYAMKVGTSSVSSLNFENEFKLDSNSIINDNPSYPYPSDRNIEIKRQDDEVLDVYDVLIAGVGVND